MPLSSQFESQQLTILEKLISQQPFLGWNEANLHRVSQSLGIDNRTILRSFPDGMRDVFSAHSTLIDTRMLVASDALKLACQPVRVRIARLVLCRLTAMSSHKQAISSLLPLLLTPEYLPTSTHMLYRTVDKIWRKAGDQSTDFNFYSKRALLAGVYSSTTLCWLTDESKEHIETQRFLERRIANVMSLGKIKADFRSWIRKK